MVNLKWNLYISNWNPSLEFPITKFLSSTRIFKIKSRTNTPNSGNLLFTSLNRINNCFFIFVFEYFSLFSEMPGAIPQVSQHNNLPNLLQCQFDKNLKRGMFFLHLTLSQTSMFNLSKSFKTVSHSDSLFSRLTKNFYQESENFDDNIYTHVFSAISRIDRLLGWAFSILYYI